MFDFAGRTALVTGGSQGLGYSIARAFSDCGARVVVVSRNAEDAAPKEWDAVSADLSTLEGCREVHHWFERQGVALDVLVNNAGMARFAPLVDTDDALLEAHVAVNLMAPFRLCRAFAPLLRARGGSIINISSYFARRMLRHRPSAAYSMTKGGLDALTKALAFELGGSGVRVNGIAPGTVKTPLFRQNMDKLSEDARRQFEQCIPQLYPLQRIGTPDDISPAALFLASDSASWITGAVLEIDGGLTTH